MGLARLIQDDQMLGFLCGAAALKFAALWTMHRRRPHNAELVGTVSALNLHPVKSCGRIQLQEALVTCSGLQPLNHDIQDRHLMIARPSGDFVTARQFPAMVLIQPLLSDDGHQVMLQAPGQDTLTLDLRKRSGDVDTYRIWTDHILAMDFGDAAAAWVSAYLGADLRVIYASPHVQKRALLQLSTSPWHEITRPQDKVAFHDFAPFLLASDSSLVDLNSRLGESEVDMRNFRPNITVTGSQPWDEDDWRVVYIGDNVKLSNLKPCDRCVMTTIDPEKGVKSENSEPLSTLKTFRVDAEVAKSPLFGINLFTDFEGKIKIGDPVYVIRGKRILPNKLRKH